MEKLLVAALLIASGCTGPLPEGFEIEGQEVAIQLAHRFWGADNYDAPTPHGEVRFVTPNCVPVGHKDMTGFVDSGMCVFGVEVDGKIWISTRNNTRFSMTSLCHEALHQRIGDTNHRDDRWGVNWSGVDACRAFLARQPGDEMGKIVP